MKSKLQLLTIGLFIGYSNIGKAQCVAGTGQFNTVMNNYQTNFLTDNDMFWNFATDAHKTFIPKNSKSSPIFAASAWMGGYKNGALSTACITLRQNGVDFWPGPIDTAKVDSLGATSLCGLFDTFYPIYKTQVDSQKNHLYTSSNIPNNILNWPGNGLPTYHTSYKLAPYQDVNHNNTYDPINGDYPIMYGDYSVYQINNDRANKHGESGGLPMGIENHITSYVIDCNNDSALWNTMFLHYDVINRSSDTITNFLFSMWSDFSCGLYYPYITTIVNNGHRNYLGCDTNLNIYYAYNGTGYDNDSLGLTGYHQYLTAMAGVFLNQKLSRFTSYNNIPNQVDGNLAGAIPQQYYNLMNGMWKNGTPVTYGGGGNAAGGTPTKYLFTGDPVANTGWTEPNAGIAPNGRRGLGSCGPYTFYPHDTLKIDFAYVFARDYTHPGDSVAAIPILRQYVQNVQHYYNTNTTPCGSTFGSGIKQVANGNSLQASIYPNPSTGSFTIETNSDSKQTLTMYDINGRVILSQTIKGKTTIDAGSLYEGVYNASLQSNESVVNKRLVIVK